MTDVMLSNIAVEEFGATKKLPDTAISNYTIQLIPSKRRNRERSFSRGFCLLPFQPLAVTSLRRR